MVKPGTPVKAIGGGWMTNGLTAAIKAEEDEAPPPFHKRAPLKCGIGAMTDLYINRRDRGTDRSGGMALLNFFSISFIPAQPST